MEIGGVLPAISKAAQVAPPAQAGTPGRALPGAREMRESLLSMGGNKALSSQARKSHSQSVSNLVTY